MKGRPPALTPGQQDEVRRRLAAGETAKALAVEFKVGRATIQRLSGVSVTVRKVAETVAAAQTALASLPVQQQHMALSLAEKLRSISDNLASAAEYGAKTAHRLQALANSQVSKVDDADPMKSVGQLRDVGVLTKLANESASIALNLVAANKDRVKELNSDPPLSASIPAGELADATLEDLMRVRGPTA